MENTESFTIFDTENTEFCEDTFSYPPIPDGIVKQEPPSEEDNSADDECELVAYPPLPHGEIKEESGDGDGRDEFISKTQQTGLRQMGGRKILLNEGTGNAPIVVPFVDYQALGNKDDTGGLRANDQKKTRKGYRSSETTRNSSSRPILRSPSKESSTLKISGYEVKQLEAEELEMAEYDSGGNEEQNAEYDGTSEHSSLDGVFSTDEEDMIQNHSLTGPGQREKNIVEGIRCEEKEKPPIKCKNCGQDFKAESYLKRHLTSTCRIEPQFHCKECGHQFKRKQNLQKHLMTIHHIEKSQLVTFGAGPKTRPALPFKCDKCSRSYKQKKTLTRHLKYECEVDPSFPCTFCDYRAKRKGHIKRHLTETHGLSCFQFTSAFGAAAPDARQVQPFVCEKCGRTYKNKKDLKRHLTYECGLAPSFSCIQCEYRAKRKFDLKEHLINVHAGTGLSLLDL